MGGGTVVTAVLTAEWLAQLANGRVALPGLPGARGVAFHTARLRPGDAFFALPGASTHGIRFADEVLARGAAFIVSDAPHPQGVRVADPAAALLTLGRWARGHYTGPVVGISGSAGKTSTKALAGVALEAESSPGNLNTPLALAATLLNSFLSRGGNAPLVLELGIDHLGEMETLVELVRPSHALLTLVAPSHLLGLGTLAGVAREKAKLLEAAPHAFASAQAHAHLSPELRARTVSYGLEPEEAEVLGRRVAVSGEGQTLEVRGVAFTLPYPGDAMARNAIGALALAERLGVPLDVAARRLARVRLEPGRLQLKRSGGLLILDDSYNSNPASALQALAVLRDLPAPRVAILGDMLELGPESARYHRELGEASRDLDLVVAIGPEARHIALGHGSARYARSLQEALPLLQKLPAGSSVLVKASRGMRFEQIVSLLLRQGAPA